MVGLRTGSIFWGWFDRLLVRQAAVGLRCSISSFVLLLYFVEAASLALASFDLHGLLGLD